MPTKPLKKFTSLIIPPPPLKISTLSSFSSELIIGSLSNTERNKKAGRKTRTQRVSPARVFLSVKHLGAKRPPAAVDLLLSLLEQLGVWCRRLPQDVVAGGVHLSSVPCCTRIPDSSACTHRQHSSPNTPATQRSEHTGNTTVRTHPQQSNLNTPATQQSEHTGNTTA